MASNIAEGRGEGGRGADVRPIVRQRPHDVLAAAVLSEAGDDDVLAFPELLAKLLAHPHHRDRLAVAQRCRQGRVGLPVVNSPRSAVVRPRLHAQAHVHDCDWAVSDVRRDNLEVVRTVPTLCPLSQKHRQSRTFAPERQPQVDAANDDGEETVAAAMTAAT
jgi:hypothetical protein